MSASRQRPAAGRPRIRRLIAAQVVVLALAAGIAGALAGRPAAAAAALGGATCLLPQAWFAYRVLGPGGDAGQMLRALYLGEATKLAAIVVLLVAIFRAWPDVPLAPLILGFIGVQAVHWFAPILLEN